MGEKITLKETFETLKKRMLMIISIVIGAVALSAIISYFVLTPIYQSSSQFIVNQDTGAEVVDYNQLRSNVEIINTYNVVIKSSAILQQVTDEMNLSLSAEQLREKLTVSSAQNSQVVTVTATDANPEIAASIANTTVEVFQEKLPDLMNVNNVSVLSSASVSANPEQISPKPLTNMAIGLVLGIMIGVGLAILLEYMDNTVRTEADIESKLGMPVLGVISHINEEDMVAGRLSHTAPNRVRGGQYNGPTKKTI